MTGLVLYQPVPQVVELQVIALVGATESNLIACVSTCSRLPALSTARYFSVVLELIASALL